MGQWRTTVSIYEVPNYLYTRIQLPICNNSVTSSLLHMTVCAGSDVILNCKSFNSITNWLDLEGCRVPVIVTGRKPVCWYCGGDWSTFRNLPGEEGPVEKYPTKVGISPHQSKAKGKKVAPVVSPTARTSVLGSFGGGGGIFVLLPSSLLRSLLRSRRQNS